MPAEAEQNAGSVLQRLAADVGDEAVVTRFVREYLLLLPARVERIQLLVPGADAEAAKVAILSLETTSAMLGGGDVARAGRALRRALGAGDAVAADLERLQDATERFRSWLDGHGFSA